MSTLEALFDTFNAKHKAESEVAATFVPPSQVLDQLISHNNVVLTGPRGSGKTTLLKMLTVPALANWNTAVALETKKRVDFVSIFVPADRSWHGQLKQLGGSDKDGAYARLLGLSTFTTHIFKAIANAFIDWQSDVAQGDVEVRRLVPAISFEQEQGIVAALSRSWHLKPHAFTFFEMKSALAQRLSTIGALKNKLKYLPAAVDVAEHDFLFCDYREGIKLAHNLHNHASGLPSRRWLVMFDELEVAPSEIQESLIKDLRGTFEQSQINYRLALAPYNRNFVGPSDEAAASPQNDYQHIDLSFARKDRGLTFSRQLCDSLLRQSGVDRDIGFVLGGSPFSFDDLTDNDADRGDTSRYSKDAKLGRVFGALADKDASFRHYLTTKKISLDQLEDYSELQMASTLRKVRNIVIIREYFSKPSRSGIAAESLSTRSRKTYRLYAGVPSILALTEGNPRALINLISPLIRSFKSGPATHKVSESRQADEIERSIRIMRSLLRSIPAGEQRREGGVVLKVLDDIGSGFYQGVVSTKFSEQPALSFRVDSGLQPAILSALGKALNMGALVYVPDHGSEEVISSLVGKRFRLNYMLASYYKLPLALDREVSLSTLLAKKSNVHQEAMEFPDAD
ncbi:hypothetical protein AB9E09_09465 [Rhizobium leguminosarum]|uniref:ORC-CDC6 family AAA ATPase n=1 Tax=Rhizobium leguminosarum TaxID=384 RepID=UPI003F95F9F0